MPNGGSDCCGTCWFNRANGGRSGPKNHDRTIPSFCEIRGIALNNPFYTYCANHPYRRPERDPIPIGPILHQGQITPETPEIAPPLLDPNMGTQRVVWKASPDTEEVRKHLLELLALLEERPAQNEFFPPLSAYFPTITVATTVVWQLGEFREARAMPRLMRILTHHEGGIVEYARKALAKIRQEDSPIRETNQPNEVRQLVLDVLDWLRDTYSSHRFFTERDVEWTVQKRLWHEICSRQLPYEVFHNFRMPRDPKSLADLVVVRRPRQPTEPVEFAIEFKYEPAHSRNDILPGKFPVVEDWKKVVCDVDRVQRFVREKHARSACSLFIDEGGYYRKQEAAPNSCWKDWDINTSPDQVFVLISEA